MAVLSNSNAISPSGYDINNSLRFRSSASAYLSRTFSTPTSAYKWTLSFWIKLGTGATTNYVPIFGAGATPNNLVIDMGSAGLRLFAPNTGATLDIETSQVFRDPSAWYHVIYAVDTTQATASNRIKLYINGSQVTALSIATYPALNATFYVNQNATAHYIGNNTGSSYFDGYLAEVNFIDGQQLTPSSFGATDAVTGVWQPAKYTGTYGTNGFYLKFSDIATTSGSNAGLGKDFSGNSNYWTTNNISVTSGTTYDAMTDSPTNTSATVANYAVCNPLALGTSQTSLTQGNLYAIPTAGANNWGTVFSTIAIPTSGKWYIEATATVYTGVGNSSSLGVVDSSTFIPTSSAILYQYTTGQGFDGILCQLFSDYVQPISHGVGGTSVTGQTGTTENLMIALDVDNGKVYAGYNGTWFNSANPAGGTGYISSRTFSSTDVVAGHTTYNGSNDQAQYFNFGQRPFTYTPPTGFKALNTYNLPDSTIKKGNSYMDATLYTGNGGTQSVVNSSGFKPDLVWSKGRSQASGNHLLTDSVRGTTKSLMSNDTGAEGTRGVTAFNSNGFTYIYPNEGGDGNFNAATYVAWQWQAGQGSTSSNTSGSITSTVSVNTTAGFSVVTYTGTGTANQTVGHGLGVAPAMVIIKGRGNAFGWATWHKSLGTAAGTYLALNTTAASATDTTMWQPANNSPTVISVSGSASASSWTNAATTYVAYCWAEIAGFSKFGSYTGNGSADGPFVYTGFRPKWIMIKRTDTTADWQIIDTPRQLYNDGAVANQLRPNSSVAEASAGTYSIDILSNGFKDRTGASTNWNTNGGTYIYAAFAESPFKNSLAR